MQSIRDVLVAADKAFAAKKLEEAANLYEFVLCRNPSHDYALYCLGSVLMQLGRNGVGMALLQRSIEENPKRPEALHNLGIGLRAEGHDDAAVKVYQLALEQKESAQTLSNLAGCFINRGMPEKCVEWAEKGLQVDPNDKSCQYHKGLAYLEMGKLEEGFKLYEARKFINEWNPRVYKHKEWDGSPVDWLLIHGEQGVGDEILFMAWLSEIKKKAKNVVIEATPRLVKLFEKNFGVPCYPDDKTADQAHPYDAMVAMGSLPNFAKPVPPHGQYIFPDQGRVNFYRAKLEVLGKGPYIGFSWFGGLKKTHTHLRNASVEKWRPLTRYGIPISIQYGLNGKTEHKALGLPHWQEAIDDFEEFAALLKALDLVVCVNSTPVHFCGAMDVPCWTLTPSQPAWRYQLKGEMPWYRSVKQYRQPANDWKPVFAQVERDLALYCRKPEHQALIERLAA